MNKLYPPLFAALTLALLFVAPPARAQDRPVRLHRGPLLRLQLENQAGRTLPTYFARGGTYVQGNQGRRYNIRLFNDSAGWVEAVMSVDGRGVIHGRPANLRRDRGYLVPPGSSVLIEGYRTSMNAVAAFRFSSPASSYAGRFGHPGAAGVIRLAAYRERPAPIMVPGPQWRSEQPPALDPWSRRGSAPEPDDAGRPSPMPQGATKTAPEAYRRALPFQYRDRVRRRWHREHGHLGTAFGEQRTSRIMETTFARANPSQPDQQLTVHYDDADGLRALGIGAPPPLPRPRPLPRPAVAIESRFAEPPPPWPDWRWEWGYRVR